MNTNIYTSEEKTAFSSAYSPGSIIEVEISKIIKPSQIITSFNNNFFGRLSLVDITENMVEAEFIFNSYHIGQTIKCVILNIDFDNQIISLSQKFILSENVDWNELNCDIELPFKLIQKLHYYNLVKSDSGFWGLVPKEIEIKNVNFEVFRIKDKIEDGRLLSLVAATPSNILTGQIHQKQNLYRSIDVEFRDNSSFINSMLYHYATIEDIQTIKSGFDLDPLIFSKDVYFDQPLYLEIERNDLVYSNSLKNVVFNYFFPDREYSEENEKELLTKISSLKFWFNLTFKYEEKKNEPGTLRELTDFTLFNEDVYIYVNVLKSKNGEPKMVIKSLNIGHDWARTTERKKKFSKNGAFLFLSEIVLLSPYMTTPIGLVQKDILKHLELKTKCKDIAERLKLASGEILRQEGKTLGIIDRYIEYQLDLLESQKADSVFIKEFTRAHGETEGVTINIQQEDDIELELEQDSRVNIRIKRPSLKENKDDELTWLCDATYKSTTSGFQLTFNQPIEIEYLKKGFYFEKKISRKNLQIQQDIIKDFLGKKIKLDHIESLLIKPERIVAPTIVPIEFNNQELLLTEKIQPDNNQVMAVKKAVGNENIFLIQGPPGTGKTTVIAEIIEQLQLRGEKILVAGQNHVAVDNVLQKMSSNPSLTLLRAGRADRVAPDLVRFCVENIIEEYKNEFKNFIKNQSALCSYYIALKQLKLDHDELLARYRDEVNRISSGYTALGDWYREKHFNLRVGLNDLNNTNIEKSAKILEIWAQNIQTEYEILLKPFLFNCVDVVFATCIGIRTDQMFKEQKRKFDTVIIDEAGKASIAETLVAMELGKKVILVGDQMQLPPYMDSTLIDINNPLSFQNSQYGSKYLKDEVNHALKTSFFEFLINRIEDGKFPQENLELLNYQHRMHPNIGEFVSSSFYQGKVQMGKKTHLNRWKLPVPFDKEIVFFDTSNSDNPFEIIEGQSIKNELEAKSIAEYIIPLLIDNEVPPSKIAIIAPYKAQVTNIIKYMGKSPKCPVDQIDVSTLDSFQGKEYDIIIFSFTRSANHNKPLIQDGRKKFIKVGFLDDARRLNVAFSRAKKKLVLIGNSKYLSDSRSHFDSGIFNYTDLFKRLIQLSKNHEIGNFVSTADYIIRPKKSINRLQKGMWVLGKIVSEEKTKNGYSYGKMVLTQFGKLLAPLKEEKKPINPKLRSYNIGDDVQGFVLRPKNKKGLIIKILPKGWNEIKKIYDNEEKIEVKVLDINWMGITIITEQKVKGLISINSFKKRKLPVKNSFIKVTISGYNILAETIDFKLTS